MDAYVQLKDAGVAIMVNLSETWLRNHQVLPQVFLLRINLSIVRQYILALLTYKHNILKVIYQ